MINNLCQNRSFCFNCTRHNTLFFGSKILISVQSGRWQLVPPPPRTLTPLHLVCIWIYDSGALYSDSIIGERPPSYRQSILFGDRTVSRDHDLPPPWLLVLVMICGQVNVVGVDEELVDWDRDGLPITTTRFRSSSFHQFNVHNTEYSLLHGLHYCKDQAFSCGRDPKILQQKRNIPGWTEHPLAIRSFVRWKQFDGDTHN